LPQNVPMANLRWIGLWHSDEHPGLPHPETWVDPAWGGWEKREVEYYLSSGSLGRAWMGYSECRLCGQENGAGEFTDGWYVWPEGLVHYVKAHSVKLPDEFLTHALARRRQIEEAPRDESWWRTFA